MSLLSIDDYLNCSQKNKLEFRKNHTINALTLSSEINGWCIHDIMGKCGRRETCDKQHFNKIGRAHV